MPRGLATDDNKRKIKICLLGDTGAGKTALLNRLIYGTFHPPDPSIATDYRVLNTWVEDTKETVHVEVWEFPGNILSAQRNVHLMSTFFHAAVICYSIEDVHNLESLTSVWKPALDASLHDRPLFVLGLKKDLRPTFPELGLAFLPATERVTSQHGFDAATITRANGYAECSAKTGENCFEAWEGIVSFVVSNLVETERELSRNKSAIFREKVKDSAKETAKDAGRAVNRVFSWIPKLSQKKMKDATAGEAGKRRSTVSESALDRRSPR
ncbi:P-loop containing nucleoside triphosphate hydrolase protein [Cladorrhinum samala]|uniref:P-loop containing nucleoside triphosphate hydrolase protein n=1 Tax=Cladorrhinum samala TaxID=585594 RepID=A0AAV9HM57_9PEZI|nr:P-loop containing nucleoside triphosphate hydrolase protein [Cladorrhinum samala]